MIVVRPSKYGKCYSTPGCAIMLLRCDPIGVSICWVYDDKEALGPCFAIGSN